MTLQCKVIKEGPALAELSFSLGMKDRLIYALYR